MSAIDNIVSHFEGHGVKEIHVPEWNLTIYSKPINVNEQRSLMKVAKNDDLKFLVRALVMKAMDKDGNKLFDLMEDEPKLLAKADPNVLARVVTEMTATPSVEDMEGN